MAETELVSVILPTFNRAATLPRAISSVLNQSYRNLELLVVDDGSTDATEAVVQAFADPRLQYIALPTNGGASRARNIGMRMARGRYLAFQDSDDEWLSGKLERSVSAAEATGERAVTVFHTKFLYGRDAPGNYGPHCVCCLPEISAASQKDLCKLIHRKNLISTQTLLISREAFDRVGFFDEDLINCEDWAYGVDLFYNSVVVFIDTPLVVSYLQSDSISLLPGFRAQLRVLQKLRKLPDSRPAYIGEHLGRIGWGIAKLRHKGLARRILKQSLALQPGNWRNWARFGVNEMMFLSSGFRKGGPSSSALYAKRRTG